MIWRQRSPVYTYLADVLPKKNLRLFIGISGFDLHERVWVNPHETFLPSALNRADSGTKRAQLNQRFSAIKWEWEGSVALHAWCEGAWIASQALDKNGADPLDLLEIFDASASRGGPRWLLRPWNLGGYGGRVSAKDSALGGRDANFMLSIDTSWTDPTQFKEALTGCASSGTRWLKGPAGGPI